ncbi:MAG: bifunctional riboflavin kinase/FAD synthetase [Ardenticatenaceae bacterium]|nr:bifunctional riboflavin kinase/FAD synthetase [Ardenticatenaceae bacterium]HBY98401.1 bifunctional riboflavin kinase/FMN adenylyltransferase [Chloroflexota bacterium]
MLVLRDDFTPFQGESILTIGKFDGLHLGHQALINQVKTRARALDLDVVPALLTFDPHPAAVLSPRGQPPLLTPLPEKLRLLDQLGIELVALVTFTRETAATSAADFLRYLQTALRPRELWVGPDFALGHNREGDLPYLRRWGAEHNVVIGTVEPVQLDGETISGSRIRALLDAGDMEGAARLLGRPMTVVGLVARGDQRGHQIGFPTANVVPEPAKAIPANGVYVTLAEVAGVRYPSVTNVGVRPTFGGTKRLVEAHLLDWEGDLYGRELTVHFLHRLRPELKFNGIAALVAQIEADVAQAREWLATAEGQ